MAGLNQGAAQVCDTSFPIEDGLGFPGFMQSREDLVYHKTPFQGYR